jgi:hypothetical protein
MRSNHYLINRKIYNIRSFKEIMERVGRKVNNYMKLDEKAETTITNSNNARKIGLPAIITITLLTATNTILSGCHRWSYGGWVDYHDSQHGVYLDKHHHKNYNHKHRHHH